MSLNEELEQVLEITRKLLKDNYLRNVLVQMPLDRQIQLKEWIDHNCLSDQFINEVNLVRPGTFEFIAPSYIIRRR